jgi:hypothetical protein
MPPATYDNRHYGKLSGRGRTERPFKTWQYYDICRSTIGQMTYDNCISTRCTPIAYRNTAVLHPCSNGREAC